eukprot:scaffold102919_cov60-Phaeocystis_antarctica.AAC.1
MKPPIRNPKTTPAISAPYCILSLCCSSARSVVYLWVHIRVRQMGPISQAQSSPAGSLAARPRSRPAAAAGSHV